MTPRPNTRKTMVWAGLLINGSECSCNTRELDMEHEWREMDLEVNAVAGARDDSFEEREWDSFDEMYRGLGFDGLFRGVYFS